MKIKLLKDCLIGGQHCPIGEVVDVSEQDGAYLVSRGHATLESNAKAKKSTVKRVKLVISRSCLIGGKHVDRGDVIDVDVVDEKYLVGHRYAFPPKSDLGASLIAEVKKESAAKESAA